MPLLLQRPRGAGASAAEGDIGALVLWVRAVAIVGVLALGFAYERMTGENGPGLDRPALVRGGGADRAGLSWRPLLAPGAARGAIAGMIAGSLIWFYLLLLPSIRPDQALSSLLTHGPMAIAWLQSGGARRLCAERARRRGGPVASCECRGVCRLFADPPAELRARARTGERLCRGRRRRQAAGVPPLAFVDDGGRARGGGRALSRGRAGAAGRSLTFMREHGLVYDPALEAGAQLIRHAEFLLSPAMAGPRPRARCCRCFLRPRTVSGQSALKLIDEASAAIQSSRDQLQHALDHAKPGHHRL